MAQSGLHIPAQSGSELPCFQAIYADIGDEQSIEQSLSTFSGHITNIVHILKKADRRSLVILDELGAGTDPQEGAALARAILSHLLAQGITTFVATHYPELKTFAHTTPGVVNASLEFNVQTLRPTYKLTIGLPGRSNALAIAQRLGLPQEVIEAAKSEINPDDLRADKLIGDIHRQRKIAFKESEKAERARSEARRLERRPGRTTGEDRRRAPEGARTGARRRRTGSGSAEDAARNAQRRVEEGPPAAGGAPGNRRESGSRRGESPGTGEAQTADDRPQTIPRTMSSIVQRPLSVGEKVVLRTLGNEGTITSLDEDEAEVQAGPLRMRVRLEELKRKSRDHGR